MNSAESKIKEALHAAVELKNSGNSPTEAVSKAASRLALNPDMTERLVEAFNIALTNATIRDASDKTASFPLADRGAVMKNVFDIFDTPDTSKTASAGEAVEASFSCSPGEVDLSWLHGGMVKQASLDNPEELVRQTHGELQKIGRNIEAAAQDAYASEVSVEREFRGLLDVMSQSAFLGKFANFETQALSEYGEQVRPILDNLYEAAGLNRFNEIRAQGEFKIASKYFEPTEAYRRFDLLMEATQDLHNKTAALENVAGESSKSAAELYTLLAEAVPATAIKTASKRLSAADLVLAAPSQKAAEQDSPGVDISGLVGKSPFDRGSGLLPSSWQGVASSVTDAYSKAHGDAVKKFYTGPKDEVGMERDNLTRSTILQELLAKDEIISKADPATVQDSYNALLQVAPTMTLNKAVVQSWLRQASASQAVDPFMAKQLLDLEKGSLTNKALERGEKPPAS
jgi:hypothetical protein